MGRAPNVDALASRWQRVDLRGFPQLLQYEDCEAWLHRRLCDLGLLKQVHPRLGDFLTTRARQVAAHNILIDLQRDAFVETLNRSHTPHVMLKGSAYSLVRDRYPYIAERSTGDVDVLLPGEVAYGVWSQLRQQGLDVAMATRETYEDHHHLIPLAGPPNIVLELHTSTAKTLAPAEAWRRVHGSSLEVGITRAGRAEGAAGALTRVPCPTELFWHAVSHAHSNPLQAFRLRLLQDAATIWASGEEIDWDAVAARLQTDELPSAPFARRWLAAAGWLAGHSQIDERLIGDTAPFDLHRALRWRLYILRALRPTHRMWIPNARADDLMSRTRRFAIDVATATDLGVRPTHRTLDRRRLGRAAMRVGGGVIRTWYRRWRNRERGTGC